jgi:3-deoxy-7-phosphoheptulonate synthase
VHQDPAHAISDGRQSLTPENFAKMVSKVKLIAEIIDRRLIPAKFPLPWEKGESSS